MAAVVVVVVAGAVATKRQLRRPARGLRHEQSRVVVNQGGLFFKDAATATEIIVQTAETLLMEMEASIQPPAIPTESAGLPGRY